MNAPVMRNVVSARRERSDARLLVADASRARKPWSLQPIKDRLDVLKRFRDLLAADARQLAAMVDQRPVIDTLTGELLPLLEACRYLERNAARILRPRRRTQRAASWLGRVSVETAREPLGTVLIIGPSNYGLMLPGVQALQALVAGNAVIVKPAPGSKPVLERFWSLLVQSGLPEGLLTVIDDSPEAAGELVQGLVDRVVFTGSSKVGQRVLSRASEYLVPATVELSGWDACLVLESADLDRTARAIAFALEFNNGRTCMAPRRILVSETTHDAFVARLTEQLSRVRPVHFAPEVAETAHDLVRDAIAAGAELAAGRLTAEGMAGPVLLTGVTETMAIFSTEAFGPIGLVTKVKGASDRIAKANATAFGLGATIFGEESEALSLVASLDVGVVMINDAIAPVAHPAVTIAARRGSGFGATRGAEGLLAMTRPKTVVSSRARHPLHLKSRGDRDERLLDAYINAAYRNRWSAKLIAAFQAVRALRHRRVQEKSSWQSTLRS